MEKKKLYRSFIDRKLTGVCGGIAEYFGLDSTWVRLGFVVLSLAYGGGLLAYIIASLIIPQEPTA